MSTGPTSNTVSEDPITPVAVPPLEAGSLRLLIVEDKESELDVIRGMLAESGQDFEVQSVTRVEDALQKLHKLDFAAVLLDLSLPPEGRGLDTLRRAQVAASTIPIIVMTTKHDEKLALEAVRAGAQDFLVKGTWDGQLLNRTILYAVERHRTMRELEETRRQQQYLASHDHLTGLTNRGAFEEALRRNLSYALRHQDNIGLFYLDLDGFKAVNDGLGHAAGDEVLKTVARRLTDSLRKSDLAARLGGDEFIVMIQDVKSSGQAAQCASRLLELLAEPMTIAGQDYRLTTSIGIAIFPEDGQDSETLARAADIAMYDAKSRGKNQFEFFSKALSDRASSKLELETKMRRALENENFLLYYQPIVDMRSRELVRVEALLKWNDPVQGLLGAADFIPAAEELGLVVPIGEWVLRTACRQWKAWRSAEVTSVPIAVNLSPQQFWNKSLIEWIATDLAEAEMPTCCLELELTETAMMKEEENSLRIMEAIHALGVGISLDDFGTAYSSLSRLQTYPIDRVKIDRSFVSEIPANKKSIALTSGIIALTHSLGLKVVAEGVETAEQLDFLAHRGCDEAQGYLFSPPLPAEELPRWLKRQGGHLDLTP